MTTVVTTTTSAYVEINEGSSALTVEILTAGPKGPPGPPGPVVGLGDLTDVNTTAKVAKSILYYDAVSGEWKGDSAQTIFTVTDYGNF
jgi:hypothetical protein